MKLHVLFGQRKCEYPEQYAPEALACMDDIGDSNNPEYLEEEQARHEKSGEFDRLCIVALSIKESDVRAALYPEQKVITATVVQAD